MLPAGMERLMLAFKGRLAWFEARLWRSRQHLDLTCNAGATALAKHYSAILADLGAEASAVAGEP